MSEQAKNLQIKETSRYLSEPARGFYVNKRTAEAHFRIPFQVLGGINGLRPSLSLEYQSGGSASEVVKLPYGWTIRGMDGLKKLATGDVTLDGRIQSATVNGKNGLIIKDQLGRKSEYGGSGISKSPYYPLKLVSDLWGNQIRYAYREDGLVDHILYGRRDFTPWMIKFQYHGATNFLTDIEFHFEGHLQGGYQLRYQNDQIAEVIRFALQGSEVDEMPLHSFEYQSKAKQLLQTIRTSLGTETQIDYRADSVCVDVFSDLETTLTRKPVEVKFRVISNHQMKDWLGKPYFEKLSIQAADGQLIEEWIYETEDEFAGYLREFRSGHQNSKTGVFQAHKKTVFEYEWHEILAEPVIASIETSSWLDDGSALPKIYVEYGYDAYGNQNELREGSLVVQHRYQMHQGVAYVVSEKQYDISKSPVLNSHNLLSARHFSQEFEPVTGRLLKTISQVQLDKDRFSNPEITYLNSWGLIDKNVSVTGQLIHYQYDDYGWLKAKTLSSSDGKSTLVDHYDHDPFCGQCLKETSGLGLRTETLYDPFGVTLAITEQQGPRAKVTRNFEKFKDRLSGALVQVITQPVGNQHERLRSVEFQDHWSRPLLKGLEIAPNYWQLVILRYDSANSTAAQSMPFELKSRLSELTGKLKHLKVKRLQWQEIQYTKLGLEKRVQSPDGSTTEMTYGTADKVALTVTEQRKNVKGIAHQTTIRTLSATGVLKTRQQFDKGSTVETYDLLGRLLQKTDRNGSQTWYEWDFLGNCISETNPVIGKINKVIGSDLRLNFYRHNETTETYHYDWLGRITCRKSLDQKGKSLSHYFNYREDPKAGTCRTKMTSPEGWQITETTDLTGHVLERQLIHEKQGDEFLLKTDLWSNGQVKMRTYPDGRKIGFEYDGRGFLRTATDLTEKKPLVRLEGHDSRGIPVRTTYGNGIVEYRKQDERGQPRSHQIFRQKPGQQAMHYDGQYLYSPDMPGQLSRLQVSGDGFADISDHFEYDRFGRLQTNAVDPVDTPSHMLVDKGGYCTQLRVGKAAYEMAHSDFGHLSRCQKKTSDSIIEIQNEYDLRGQLIRRMGTDIFDEIHVDHDFQITRYPDGSEMGTIKVPGGFGVVAELTKERAANTSTLPSKPILAVSNTLQFTPRTDGIVYLHSNFQGSTVLATDEGGNQLCRVEHTPFGEIDLVRTTGQISFDCVYAGMIYQPLLNLYSAGARTYCPAVQKFLSPDPLRVGLDLYAYPADPINFVDDNGMCPYPNLRQRLRDNYGRSLNELGLTITVVLSSFLCFLPAYFLIFGYEIDEAFRWTLGIGIWFGTTVGLTGAFHVFNRRMANEPDNPMASYYPTWAVVGHRIMIATAVAVTYLGPLLAFIGVPGCNHPYHLFSCSNEFYKKNLVRGGTSTPVAVALSNLIGARVMVTPFRNRDLSHQYGTGVALAWTSYYMWQVLDIFVTSVVYGANAGESIRFKRAFFLGEAFLGLMMAQPNIFWGLLPVLMPGRFWDNFFLPRSQREGAFIPWFAEQSAPEDEGDVGGVIIELEDDPHQPGVSGEDSREEDTDEDTDKESSGTSGDS